MHACVYDPSNGELKRLSINFSDYMKDLRVVYDLYHENPDVSRSPLEYDDWLGDVEPYMAVTE